MVNYFITLPKWSDVQKEMFVANWSGSNTSAARMKVADKISNWLMSDKNPFVDQKHVTLISHSHGGNVSKIVKNKLD